MSYRSPFHEMHLKASAVLEEIAGWSMPWHYGDWQAEYDACRETLGVYDMSHYGRIRVKGSEARAWFVKHDAGQANELEEGRQCFLTLCTADFTGRVLLQHQDKGYLVITEPGDRLAVLAALERSGTLGVADETFKTAMVGLRGPKALELLKEKLPFELPELTPDTVICTLYFFMRFVISVHQDEARLILPGPMAAMAWNMLEKYGEVYHARLTGWQALSKLAGADERNQNC